MFNKAYLKRLFFPSSSRYKKQLTLKELVEKCRAQNNIIHLHEKTEERPKAASSPDKEVTIVPIDEQLKGSNSRKKYEKLYQNYERIWLHR